jgi:hypothetical protein
MLLMTTGTNGKVLAALVKDENAVYISLKPCCTGLQLVELICNPDKLGRIPNVLLDVGAKITELTNVQVARTWLKLRSESNSKLKAAVYSNETDHLMVIDTAGNITSFTTSPYQHQLDVCLVYLDEAHTRGTDLKLPLGSHAAVTPGESLTKDRLVQACMRMRQLGRGHTVAFYASHEAHTGITATATAATDDDFVVVTITSTEVLA